MDPFIWDLGPCPQNLVLDETNGQLEGIYKASQSITVNTDAIIANGINVTLDAPEVILNMIEAQLGAEITVLQEGCN